jgi:hypothetical protein
VQRWQSKPRLQPRQQTEQEERNPVYSQEVWDLWDDGTIMERGNRPYLYTAGVAHQATTSSASHALNEIRAIHRSLETTRYPILVTWCWELAPMQFPCSCKISRLLPDVSLIKSGKSPNITDEQRDSLLERHNHTFRAYPWHRCYLKCEVLQCIVTCAQSYLRMSTRRLGVGGEKGWPSLYFCTERTLQISLQISLWYIQLNWPTYSLFFSLEDTSLPTWQTVELVSVGEEDVWNTPSWPSRSFDHDRWWW